MFSKKGYPSSDVQNRRRGGSTIFVIILLVIALFSGIIIGQRSDRPSTPAKSDSTSGLNFALFDQVYDMLKREYVSQPVDAKELEYGMIRGLVAGLGDPNSNFMDPEETKAFQENLSGEFEGIGIEIAIKDEVLTVVTPLPGSPAETAGLKSGDQILQIDETVSSTVTLDQAVQLIRGAKGSQVTLLISRNGEFEAKEFVITRDTIEIESVTSEIRDDGVGVIRIARFGEDTVSKTTQFAQEMLDKEVKGLVLDLRGNPGGFFQAAIEIASLFVAEGKIVSEEYGSGSVEEYKATGNAILKDMPVVVLVDEGSASASEIVAGALQDYERAKLVGTKTFGKGTVQKLESLDQDTSLRLTIARYVLPDGRKIDHVGIEPDIAVELPEDFKLGDPDPQFDRALEVLSESR